MNSSKLRALPAVGLLLPLDIAVGVILLIATALSVPFAWIRGRISQPQRVAADRSNVTIQILNWDGLHLLKESLPSVLEASRRHASRSGAAVEVVVVDNGSGDGSVAFLKE